MKAEGHDDMLELARRTIRRATERSGVDADSALLPAPIAHVVLPSARAVVAPPSSGWRRPAFAFAGLALVAGATFVALGDLRSEKAPAPVAAVSIAPEIRAPAPIAIAAPAVASTPAAVAVAAPPKTKAARPKVDVAPAIEAPAPAEAPAEPAIPAEAAAPASLDQLLDEAAPAARASEPAVAEPAAQPTVAASLSREDVRAGMAQVRPRVQACYDRFKVAGTFSVDLTIAPDGTVSRAHTVGPTSETSLCVVAAVKAASFHSWNGAPLSLRYPFKLY